MVLPSPRFHFSRTMMNQSDCGFLSIAHFLNEGTGVFLLYLEVEKKCEM